MFRVAPFASGIMILVYHEWAVVGVVGVVKRRIDVATVRLKIGDTEEYL